jgi:hypothetical protein
VGSYSCWAGPGCRPTGFRKGCPRRCPYSCRSPPRFTAHGSRRGLRRSFKAGLFLIGASQPLRDQHQTSKPFPRPHWLPNPSRTSRRQARKAHAGSVKQICPCEICLCPLMFLVGGGRRRRIALHGREMFLIEVIPSGPASMVLEFPSSVVQPASLRHACGAAVVHCSGNY